MEDPPDSGGDGTVARLRRRARALKRELTALWLAARDPRVPWYAKAVALATVAYALSPIDLIPDPIPVIGYLDDLLIVPLGIALAIRLIPPEVMAEHRRAAADIRAASPVGRRVAAAVIVAVWLLLLALVLRLAVW